MAFYGSVTDAASLAGVDVADITDAMQTAINNWIKTNIKEDGFETTSDLTEYYDVGRSDQKQLVLNHHPIISIASLIDDFRNNGGTLLDASGYVIDLITGILQLDPANVTTGKNAIYYFTKGFNTVQIIYTFGYVTVPDIISNIATLMAAKWAKIKAQQAEADGLKSIQIGDYKEAYDLTFMNIKSEFDGELIPSIKRAKALYAKGY